MSQTTKQLDRKYLYPTSIEFTDDEVIIRMPKLPVDTKSESGKMNVHATTNGWIKTEHLDEWNEQVQVNIFVGTRA